MSAAGSIEKFHFIKDSKLPALNPNGQAKMNDLLQSATEEHKQEDDIEVDQVEEPVEDDEEINDEDLEGLISEEDMQE